VQSQLTDKADTLRHAHLGLTGVLRFPVNALRRKNDIVARSQSRFIAGSRIFWALVLFLVLVFFTGGGARGDIQSLIILRPVAVLMCGFALWSLKREHVQANRFLFGMAVAIFALVGLHLIPQPPAIWGSLPGREIIAEIDKTAGLGDVWRPLTMVPSGGWNAFYSLFVPLAVLLLGAQLSREERFQLLPVLMGLGLFSGFIGLLQVIGDPQGLLYFYNVTNNGSAVGLFANRNHQAILLATLFPMLAVYACAGVKSEEQVKVRGYVALAAGVVLVPLILVTGSRAGLIVGVVGLLSVALLYRRPAITTPKKRKGNKLDLRWLLAGFAVICLGGLTVMMSRAEAFKRLSAPDQTEDLRFKAWPYVMDMAEKYFPFGSGAGSFVEVFQVDEPNVLLKPSYFNHAHNDWLELYLTFGLPGLLLLACVVFVFAKATLSAFRAEIGEGRNVLFARLGAVAVVILALGSIGDYPLRAPTLAAVLMITALWTASPRGGEVSNNTGSL
jgi:O-antigen ligase